MGLMRWEPFAELRRLRDEMDRIFNEVFTGRHLAIPTELGVRWAPSVDVYETEKELVVKAELPGLTKEDIEITAAEDTINIKGETKKEEEVKEEGYYRRERRYGSFSRTIPLPVDVQAEKTKANFQDGILEIRVPKVAEKKPKAKKIVIE